MLLITSSIYWIITTPCNHEIVRVNMSQTSSKARLREAVQNHLMIPVLVSTINKELDAF